MLVTTSVSLHWPTEWAQVLQYVVYGLYYLCGVLLAVSGNNYSSRRRAWRLVSPVAASNRLHFVIFLFHPLWWLSSWPVVEDNVLWPRTWWHALSHSNGSYINCGPLFMSIIFHQLFEWNNIWSPHQMLLCFLFVLIDQFSISYIIKRWKSPVKLTVKDKQAHMLYKMSALLASPRWSILL